MLNIQCDQNNKENDGNMFIGSDNAINVLWLATRFLILWHLTSFSPPGPNGFKLTVACNQAKSTCFQPFEFFAVEPP